MTTKSANQEKIQMITPKQEQIFIDRLVEILIMQVEADENEHDKHRKTSRIHNAA